MANKVINASEINSLEGISKGDVLIDNGNKKLIVKVKKKSLDVHYTGSVIAVGLGILKDIYHLNQGGLEREHIGANTLSVNAKRDHPRTKPFLRQYRYVNDQIASIK
jgi:hypothetical protein